MKRLFASALVLCLTATGASCGSDEERSDPPTPTTTSPATTEPELTDEEQLEDLADGWFEASDRIYDDETDVSIAASFVIDGYLERYKERYADFKARGYASRPDPLGRSMNIIESVTASGDAGTVVSCVTDGEHVILEATGEVVNDAVSSTRYETSATRTGDGWRFTDREQLNRYEGQTQCDPA